MLKIKNNILNVRNMKKEYMKPDMRVVEIKHRCRLLSGSYDSYGEKPMKMYSGSSEESQVSSEYDVY
jgi:hypothetical protein